MGSQPYPSAGDSVPPHPGAGAGPEIIRRWMAVSEPRLRIGDPGANVWQVSVRAFVRDFKDAYFAHSSPMAPWYDASCRHTPNTRLIAARL